MLSGIGKLSTVASANYFFMYTFLLYLNFKDFSGTLNITLMQLSTMLRTGFWNTILLNFIFQQKHPSWKLDQTKGERVNFWLYTIMPKGFVFRHNSHHEYDMVDNKKWTFFFPSLIKLLTSSPIRMFFMLFSYYLEIILFRHLMT